MFNLIYGYHCINYTGIVLYEGLEAPSLIWLQHNCIVVHNVIVYIFNNFKIQ